MNFGFIFNINSLHAMTFTYSGAMQYKSIWELSDTNIQHLEFMLLELILMSAWLYPSTSSH